jgi:DNA-binding transcriptional regulator GbsR (MarR family)
MTKPATNKLEAQDSSIREDPAVSAHEAGLFGIPMSGADADSCQEAARELVLAYFSRAAETIGLPRSVAQIYATLFLSEKPLAFEEIVVLSGLSKASASTGLRDLERLQGVERVVVPTDRRSFYQAQLSVRRIVGAFMAESIKPGIDDGARLLRKAAETVETDSNSLVSSHFRARLQSLLTWHDRASEILPILAVFAAPSKSD